MKLIQNVPAFFMIIMESVFLMNNASIKSNIPTNWILQDNQLIEISFLAAISFLFIWNIFIAIKFKNVN
jgi:hypothetical protein